MKITREKASQRLYHRVNTPLSIQIDGSTYKAADWSLGGFRLKDWDVFDKNIKPGDLINCIFDLPFQGFDITFDINVEVVRIDETTKELATKFVDLDDRQKELMNHFVEQLVRGAMVPIGDTILRIDSPVTPVSTKPDPSPNVDIPKSRINVKMVTMSFIYISIGLILFSLVIITIFENFMSLKINTAIVSVDLEPVISLSDGRIESVNVVENEYLYPGKPILTIDSPDIIKQITDSKIKIDQKRIELNSLRKIYEVEYDLADAPNTKTLKLLEIEIEAVKSNIALENENLLSLYDYKEKLNITSPSSGKLAKLYRKQGATINKGDTLALFEREGKPFIYAYLTHDEAREIKMGLFTKIRLLSSNHSLVGKVVDIQSDNDMNLSYRPVIDKNRNILIKIEIQMDGYKLSETDTTQFISSLNLKMGAPVEVLFPTTGISQSIINYYASVHFDNNQSLGVTL